MAKPTLFDWGDGNGKIHTKSKADHDAATKAQKVGKGRVAPPPLGYYDPNLDAQQRAETRGYENTIDDVGTGRLYGGIDLGLATNQAGVDRTRAGEDYATGKTNIETGSGRSLSDLLSARTRGTEDNANNIANLDRSYQRLGDAQAQTARKAGVEATGGANIQSARKRAANQALDKAPIDLAYQRFMADSQTSEGRIGEDKKSSLDDLLRGYTRTGENIDAGLGQAGVNYQRSMDALGTAETRAGDEHTAFGQDIDTARQMQWGGEAITGAGTPVPADPYKPKKAKRPKVKTYTSGVTAP